MVRYAKSLGLSGSALKMILAGSRNVTVHNIHVIAQALNMPPGEKHYFEALVLRDQSESPDEKSYYAARLKKIREELKHKTVRVSANRLLDQWYLPAILVYLMDFGKNHKGDLQTMTQEISAKLEIPHQQVVNAIEALKKTKVLSFDDANNMHVVFEKVQHRLAQKNYLKSVLSQVRQRMDQDFDRSSSHFACHYLTISDESYRQLRAEHQALIERRMNDASGDPSSEKVYSVTVQMLPLL